ncbi:rotamase [Falsiroseomonas bella]|uniref:Parvulin-like PPIase n=1 Tax=Falsiroseomonas bella TaxID=2184016 RepID=A0A317FGW4_9PROT|nr:peptidylprolyl isomerase [Falsiroseomonas bella]PWS37823.1 rotamase [Falsiroseomonas bella]
MRPLLRALLLSTLLAAAPAAPPALAQTTRIVAVVNGDIVTSADVDGRRRLFAINAGLPVSPQVLDRLTPQVTRLLVDERLRMQEVQRRRVAVTDVDVASAVADLERRNNLAEGQLVAQLRRAGVEPRVLYDQIRVQIGWARLIRALLGPQARPGEAEINDYIAAQKARTGQPEFLVSEIFIPVDDPSEAPQVQRFVDDVVGQLRAGVPFPLAATQFSQSQTALAGGDLGWVGPEALDPAVASVVNQMPPGAIANPIRVPGGYQIVALRQRRLVGRDEVTILSMRQVFFPFTAALNPDAPDAQQLQQLQRAQALAGSVRGCEGMEAASRSTGSDRPADPGEVRLEQLNPPPLRQMIAGLAIGRASEPIIAPDGIAVIMVCSRERRNEGEVTPDMARSAIVRDRAELLARQLQRDLRRRAQIEMRNT